MDQIANQISNVSLYDVKKYVRKAQNAVLNFSEMEAKVREATNNEPWGTPTSTMQQIAEATNNYQQFHEIMPFIYRRFTEKSASEWRQIYKSLQLLDYLVRNGSERVVDYARSHVSVVEMLRHFSYIDSRGVDQGASIRKRSEELASLLGSTDKLRAERKKAKQLNAKTLNGGYGNGGFGGSGKKYGGISSDTYRAQARYGGGAVSSSSSSQQFYGDGGGFDGSNTFIASASAASGGFGGGALDDDDEFEEYEVAGTTVTPSSRAQASSSKTAAPAAGGEDEDEDFADFQTAPSQTTAAAPKSVNANILDLFDSPAPSSFTSQQPSQQPQAQQQQQPLTSTFNASSLASPSSPLGAGSSQLSSSSNNNIPAAAAASKPQTDLFDSLWETSKTTIGSKPAQPSSSSFSSSSKLASSPAATKSTPAPAPAASSSNSSEPVDLLSF